jgi:hypothetical protein
MTFTPSAEDIVDCGSAGITFNESSLPVFDLRLDGNIVPLTGIGKFLAMIYAVLGIPLALLVLAEVGRRFTVLLKMMYGAVRRYYYTGKFRKKVVENFRNRISRRHKSSLYDVENGASNNALDSSIKHFK